MSQDSDSNVESEVAVADEQPVSHILVRERTPLPQVTEQSDQSVHSVKTIGSEQSCY